MPVLEAPRAILLAAVVLSLVPATGCGGGTSKGDYEKEVARISQDLDEARGRIGSPDSLDEAAQAFRTLQDAVEEAADDLEAIEPPADIEDDHGDLVEATRDLGRDLADGIDAAQRGDADEFRRFARRFETSSSARRADEATDSIEEKGYDLRSG